MITMRSCVETLLILFATCMGNISSLMHAFVPYCPFYLEEKYIYWNNLLSSQNPEDKTLLISPKVISQHMKMGML